MADQQPLTVSELTRKVKILLEGGFPSIAVVGELSNVRRHTSGHLYFTLKDDHAQVRGVMWRSRAEQLAVTPEDGMKVVATGRLTVYEVQGVYQIDAFTLRPVGQGELQMAFERLKAKLSAEGLFDQKWKKERPPFPQTIGVVTSPTGAALQDILKIIRRRFPGVTVILAPARVQGAGAAREIADAIADLNVLGGIDVMIVGRGGGSIEDLWAFNEEVVARAIFASEIPVISAVGHEIDFTIADFVADLRAPTPSAAAELVVPDRRTLLENLRSNWYSIDSGVRRSITDLRESVLSLLKSYAFNRPVDLARQYMQRADELQRSLSRCEAHSLELLRSRLEALHGRIAALDPALALKRGYAMVSREGRLISSRRDLHSRDAVEITFHDGTVKSVIT